MDYDKSMTNPKYDFLIVGAGVFGSVFAREMTDFGRKCLVIDKLSHIGGHCYTEEVEGIQIHKYGPHIFHTDNKNLWDYVQKFCPFTPFCHRIKVNYKSKIYSFPINLMTLYQLWGVTTPEEAQSILNQKKIPIENPKNLEEWALSQVGEEIYRIFIKGYTRKQWGRDPTELPPFIIKRLPIRLSFNDTYYNDPFQGIPVGGYTALFSNILKGIEVRLNTDYFSQRLEWDRIAKNVVYTGRIDEFFEYKFGELEYRTLRFERQLLPIPDFQGTAVVNYTDEQIPFIRITEYKHFDVKKLDHTIIVKEYPEEWQRYKTPYYPVNTPANDAIYKRYQEEAAKLPHFIFGGRLANFKYYDMHNVMALALELARSKQNSLPS